MNERIRNSLIQRLSVEFASRVLSNLNDEQRRAVVSHPADLSWCNSHDFTDPDQHMIEAFEFIAGRDWTGPGDHDDIIQAAWADAREHQWFFPTEEVAHECTRAPL